MIIYLLVALQIFIISVSTANIDDNISIRGCYDSKLYFEAKSWNDNWSLSECANAAQSKTFSTDGIPLPVIFERCENKGGIQGIYAIYYSSVSNVCTQSGFYWSTPNKNVCAFVGRRKYWSYAGTHCDNVKSLNSAWIITGSQSVPRFVGAESIIDKGRCFGYWYANDQSCNDSTFSSYVDFGTVNDNIYAHLTNIPIIEGKVYEVINYDEVNLVDGPSVRDNAIEIGLTYTAWGAGNMHDVCNMCAHHATFFSRYQCDINFKRAIRDIGYLHNDILADESSFVWGTAVCIGTSISAEQGGSPHTENKFCPSSFADAGNYRSKNYNGYIGNPAEIGVYPSRSRQWCENHRRLTEVPWVTRGQTDSKRKPLGTWYQMGNVKYKQIVADDNYLYMISINNRLNIMDRTTNIITNNIDATRVTVGPGGVFVVRSNGQLSTWSSSQGWVIIDADKVSDLKDIAVGSSLLCILDGVNTVWCRNVNSNQYYRYSDGNVKTIAIDPKTDTLYCIATDDNGKIYKYIGTNGKNAWTVVPSGGLVTQISVLDGEMAVVGNNGKDLYQLCTKKLIEHRVCQASQLDSFVHLGFAFGVVKTTSVTYAINNSGLFQCEYPCLGN